MAGDSFTSLRERLLRAGIAPRHVRRYLRELTDHLADLTERQRAAGYDEENATIRARALLGDDAELAAAMEEQPGFRSIVARYPWLMFGILPPFALILGFLLSVLAMILVGVAGGAIVPHHKIPLPVPAWFGWTVSGMMFVANFLIVLLLGALLAWTAQRQRLKPLWPLLSMALILLLNLHGEYRADTRSFGIGLGTMLPFYPAKGPFGPAGTIHWPTLLGQAALLGLPLAWLLRTRRKTIGAP